MLTEATLDPEPEPDDDDGGGGETSLTAGTTTTSTLGLDAVFRRRPLPQLRMPDGRIALKSHGTTDGTTTVHYH